jgi:dGTPase
MTHSLEVAHVGRYLGSSVVDEFHKRGLLHKYELEGDRQYVFATTVEVACLLHDIGNPPFGHFGEVAITRWFRQNGRGMGGRNEDFLGFDGNPQGFRIISKLAGDDGSTGMNLTISQLASTLKYPVDPAERPSSGLKKFGVFFSETATLEKIRSKLYLGKGVRFPLAYLMEAADDISYCLSDIEDGAEKEITTYHAIVDALREEAPDEDVRQMVDKAMVIAERSSSVNEIVSFRSALIRQLVAFASKRYVDVHNNVLDGSIGELIDKSSPEGRLLKLIKSVVRRKIYSHSSVQSLELSGLSAITSLLDSFGRLLDLSREDFESLLKPGGIKRGLEIEKRLCDFVARSHKGAYKASVKNVNDDEELVCRAHLIVDYISGMTDSFAIEMHQVLGGVRI